MAHAALSKKLFIQTFLSQSQNHFGAFFSFFIFLGGGGWGSKLYLRRWHIPLMFSFEEDWYLLDNGEETNFYVLFRFHFLFFFSLSLHSFAISLILLFGFFLSNFTNKYWELQIVDKHISHFCRFHPYSFSSLDPFSWQLPLPLHPFPTFPVRIAPPAHQRGKVITSITSRSWSMYSLKKVEDGLRCGGRNEIAIDLRSKEFYLDVLAFWSFHLDTLYREKRAGNIVWDWGASDVSSTLCFGLVEL